MTLKEKFLLIALLAVALIVRIFGIGQHSLFSDELIWMVRGKELFFAVKQLNYKFFESGWWLDKTTTEPLGLPMAFLGGTMLVLFSPGQSRLSLGILNEVVAARLPAAVIGSFFIVAYYFLLKKFTGSKVALVASILLLFDPVYLGLSRWLHQDLMLMVSSFLALILFVRSNSWKSLAVSSFFASLAILTKPHGILVAVTLLFYSLVIESKRRKREFIKFLKWGTVVAAFTIGLFPFLWKNPVSQILLYWQTQAEVVSHGQPMNFLGRIVAKPAWYYYLVIFPFHVPETILIGILVGGIGFFSKIKGCLFKIKPFVAISLIYGLLFFTTVSWAGRKLGIRYLVPLWPYVYLLASFGLVKISSLISRSWQKIYWLLVFGILLIEMAQFYPSYYLFHNHLISSKNYQRMESVGFCDGIKPSMEYLSPKLYENAKILFFDCNASAYYYTGYTLKHVHLLEDEPEFVVVEPYSSQKFPNFEPSLEKNGYRLIKNIEFRGILLANIYEKG